MSINKVILVGNVGKDPVVKYFDKGVAKATFPLATSESFNNQQGETITSTEWHNIVLWRALAEVAEKNVKKGSQLYIIGKIKTRSYVDKDGNNKYITEILADTMILLDKKTPMGGTSQHAGQDSVENGMSANNYSSGRSNGSTAGHSNEVDPLSSGVEKNNGTNAGNPFDEGISGDKNEDDLPF